MENENKTNLYTKLLKVQMEVGGVGKDSTNPFFDAKYFDINKLIQHVEPILSSHGLLLLQPIKNGEQGSVIIDTESGESVESFLMLPKLDSPQKLGSAVTYYRRYTLGSLLALQAIDDDANLASKESNKPKTIDYELKLKDCLTLDALKKMFGGMPKDKQEAFTKLKDKLKLELT